MKNLNNRGTAPFTFKHVERGLTAEEQRIANMYANGVTKEQMKGYDSYYETAVCADVTYNFPTTKEGANNTYVPGRRRK